MQAFRNRNRNRLFGHSEEFRAPVINRPLWNGGDTTISRRAVKERHKDWFRAAKQLMAAAEKLATRRLVPN